MCIRDSFKSRWHLAIMFFQKDLRQTVYPLRFHWRQPTWFDDLADFISSHLYHVCRVVRTREKSWCCLVNPFIGALRRQEYRDKKRVRVFVMKGRFNGREMFFENVKNVIDLRL